MNALPVDLQKEVQEKVNLFREPENHQMLKTHKLKGSLKDFFSFSVNYKTRVVFEQGKDGATLHAVGDHDVYK